MATDAVVSRELKSLQDELSTSQRERPCRHATGCRAAARSNASPSAERSGGGAELRDQLRELMNEATAFFEEAEKNIAAHPTESVVGALLVGGIDRPSAGAALGAST